MGRDLKEGSVPELFTDLFILPGESTALDQS